MRTLKSCTLLLVVLAANSPAGAAETLADLVNQAPQESNTLIFVDIKGLHTSSMGQSQNWAKRHEQDFYGGISGIPPTVQQLLVASYLCPCTLQKSWDVTLMRLDAPTTPAQLARLESGAIDETNPNLILSPRNAFFTILEPQFIGARSPANRQEMLRWQRFASRNAQPVVSPYLQSAAKAVDGQHVVLAMDLTDVFDAPGVRQRLKSARTLIGRTVSLDDLTKLIVTLKGITLTVQADTDLQAVMRLEFGMPANDLAAFGRTLTLEVLETAGFALDDMENWELKFEGNAMLLRGKFSEKGLRALLLPLTPTVLASAAAVAEKTESKDPTAQVSQRYFRSISMMLDELQQGKNNKSLSRISYLYKEYARKIDELPILNVDPELLKFGASVSTVIRELANQAQLQGRTNTALQSNIVESVATIPNAYYGGGYGWGYQYSAPGYEVQSNRQQVTNLMAAGNLSESARRQETWKNINAARVNVRQAMVAKYNVEF